MADNLTVDYKKLLRLTVAERVSMARSQLGQTYLSGLTPSQYAALFPDYYKKFVPSYSSLSGGGGGGTAGGAAGGGGATGGGASSSEAGTSYTPPTQSSAVKPSWVQKLEAMLPQEKPQTATEQLSTMNASAYSPQKGGSKMEGGYASSRKGPDGQAVVRTLSDYASGRSQHITLAGNPGLYGKEFIIPKISFYDKTGTLKTLTNVRAVVHDTGSAFKSAADNRFDIPIDQDASNAIMAKNHGLWKEQGVQFGPPKTSNYPTGATSAATGILQQGGGETGATMPGGEPSLGPRKEKKQGAALNIVDRSQEFQGYGSRSSPKPYKFVGVHYTGGSSLAGALSVAKSKNVGYQYLIDKDGTVHMVQNPDGGRSNHWGKNNIHPEAKNNNSVGISFVGVGNKDITEAQRKAGLQLIEQQRQKYGIAAENVLGHGEVTTNHREDNEGYGLLEPFRKMHGLTPESGKMPNIVSKGGISAWKNGNYNYNLDSLQEIQQSEAAPSLPNGLGAEVMQYYSTLKTAQEKADFANTINKAVSLGYEIDRINQEAANESKSTGKIDAVVENIEGLKFVSPLDSWKEEDLMNVKSQVGETRPGMRRGFMADRSFRSGGKTKRLHAGVDYFAPEGSPVKSAESGVVIKAQKHSGYNGTVDILHTAPDGKQYVVRYGHLNSTFPIKVGQQVPAGTVIGSLDGDAHLHMEVRDYEKYKSVGEFARPTPGMTREDSEKIGLYDPADYFAGRGRFGHMVERSVIEPKQTATQVIPEAPFPGPEATEQATAVATQETTQESAPTYSVNIPSREEMQAKFKKVPALTDDEWDIIARTPGALDKMAKGVNENPLVDSFFATPERIANGIREKAPQLQQFNSLPPEERKAAIKKAEEKLATPTATPTPEKTETKEGTAAPTPEAAPTTGGTKPQGLGPTTPTVPETAVTPEKIPELSQGGKVTPGEDTLINSRESLYVEPASYKTAQERKEEITNSAAKQSNPQSKQESRTDPPKASMKQVLSERGVPDTTFTNRTENFSLSEIRRYNTVGRDAINRGTTYNTA